MRPHGQQVHITLHTFADDGRSGPDTFCNYDGHAQAVVAHRLGDVTASLEGDVVSSLEAYVHKWNIALIVMTTHGRGGVARAWLGSVADQLVRRVSAPVLLLRPRGGEAVTDAAPFSLDRILIPVDGSALPERAIGAALSLIPHAAICYTLAKVVAPPLSVALADSVPVPLSCPEESQLRTRAHAYLDRLPKPLRTRGRAVDTAVTVLPRPAEGIMNLAVETGADLIVMGTHGRSGLTRFALGSVADAVVRGSSTPVLLFRSHS